MLFSDTSTPSTPPNTPEKKTTSQDNSSQKAAKISSPTKKSKKDIASPETADKSAQPDSDCNIPKASDSDKSKLSEVDEGGFGDSVTHSVVTNAAGCCDAPPVDGSGDAVPVGVSGDNNEATSDASSKTPDEENVKESIKACAEDIGEGKQAVPSDSSIVDVD